eukprot:4719838-Pyramimonas_sp.AAC.1
MAMVMAMVAMLVLNRATVPDMAAPVVAKPVCNAASKPQCRRLTLGSTRAQCYRTLRRTKRDGK